MTVKRLLAIGLSLSAATVSAAAPELGPLDTARIAAEQQLHQTFSNLQFEAFGPSPVKGAIYQATAGNRIVYFAPDSGHLLFAAIYDKGGVNLTALAEGAAAAKKLSAIDPAKALAIGPTTAPSVIEFTDPDCPYCQALDRFWAAKAVGGKPVRRLVYFVSGIHPQAAAKAEHILCSPDPAAEFEAIYQGKTPPSLRTCAAGAVKVAADAELTRKVGVTGTPTLIVDGKLVSGFQQAELEAFLAKPKGALDAPR